MGRVLDAFLTTADGALAVDSHQTVVLWNRAATAVLGHRSDDVLGRKCYEVLRGRDAAGCAWCRRACPVFEAGLALRASPALELATTTAGGGPIWLSISTLLIPSRRDGLSSLVHLFREVTRPHELLRVVREFAAVVSSLASATPPTPAENGGPNAFSVELTRRERDILALLAAGESTDAIAERLFVSARTVRNHVSNVLGKLGVHSRLEAAMLAVKNGWV